MKKKKAAEDKRKSAQVEASTVADALKVEEEKELDKSARLDLSSHTPLEAIAEDDEDLRQSLAMLEK